MITQFIDVLQTRSGSTEGIVAINPTALAEKYTELTYY